MALPRVTASIDAPVPSQIDAIALTKLSFVARNAFDAYLIISADSASVMTTFSVRSGFVQHGQSRVDHEVDMARSDLVASIKNAKAIYDLLKDRSEEDGIEGWVQEKLIKDSDYLNAV